MMSDDIEIGFVKHVQIQNKPLKVNEGPARRYDPTPLMVVERLMIGPVGVQARGPDGTVRLDVHHPDHPESRNRAGRNGLSLMFTGHYEGLNDFFGGSVPLGCAGENVLIESPRVFALAELGGGLLVRPLHGSPEIVLEILDVIEPCVEFSRYLCEAAKGARVPDIRSVLQYLRDGRRGFLARLVPGDAYAEISPGDRVFLRSFHDEPGGRRP